MRAQPGMLEHHHSDPENPGLVQGERRQDLLLLLLLGALWGASYLFIKIVVAEVSPLVLVAGRLLVGSGLMWALVAAKRQPVLRDRRAWATFALLGLVNTALPFTLISWGEQYISSGMSALLLATMPIFAVLLAHLVSREPTRPSRLLGVAVGFAGVAAVVVPELHAGQRTSLLGQASMVAAALCYAAGATIAQRRMQAVTPLMAATGQLSMAALLVAPASLLLDPLPTAMLSRGAILSWLCLAVLGTFLAYLVYFALLQRTTATFVSTVSYLIPVNGILLGVLVLHEPLTVGLGVGLSLILLGVLLVRG